MNYYNDFDRYNAEWLRNLIKLGVLPDGDVDNRPIQEVKASDLKGYTQCHFFAGIGGWALGLQLAGWPSARPVWTGSCPCQPFSVAGNGEGEDDERHLWPEFRRLIGECNPPEVFGEQVASALGRLWLSGVRFDLEELGYAVGAADLCAAGVSAPHIRQRLWWVADAGGSELNGRPEPCGTRGGRLLYAPDGGDNGGRLAYTSPGGLGVNGGAPGNAGYTHECGKSGGMADTERDGGRTDQPVGGEKRRVADGRSGGRVGKSFQSRLEGHSRHVNNRDQPGRINPDQAGPTSSTGRNSWSDFIWIPCADGKARRIEPGIMPLVDGVSGRVAVRRTVQQPGAAAQVIEHWYNRAGAIRGFGNAIVPEEAAVFIMAYLEAKETLRHVASDL